MRETSKLGKAGGAFDGLLQRGVAGAGRCQDFI